MREMNKYSRRRDTVWNVFFGYVNICVSIVRNILLVPLYLFYITLEEYGAWLATGSALINLIIIDFGLSGAAVQRVSYLLGNQQYRLLGRAIGTSMVAGLLLSLMLSTLAIVIAPYIPDILNLEGDASKHVYECFLLAILANALAILGVIALGILKSLHSPILAGLICVVADITSIILTILLLIFEFGLYAIAVALLFRAFVLMVAGVSASIYTSVVNCGVIPKLSIGEVRILFRNTSYLFVSSIAMKIQTQADTFFVGALVGPESAGVYGLTIRAYETVQLIVSQLGRGLAPSLANLYGDVDRNKYKKVVIKITTLILFMGVVGLGCFSLLNGYFVNLWVGEQYYAGNQVTFLIAIAGYVFLFGSIAYDVLCSSAEFKFISRVFLASAVFHIGILYFVLTSYGIEMVPIAMLLSALIWGSVFWIKVYKKLVFIMIKFSSVVKDFCVLGLTTLISVFILYETGIAANNWWSFSVYSIALILLFTAVNFIVSKNARIAVIEEYKNTLKVI